MLHVAKMTTCVVPTFSSYFYTLDERPKARYREKLRMLGGMEDPYITASTIGDHSDQCLDWLSWPNVEYPDIYNYCITSPNSYSKEELKAYKSLDAYKYFVDGWVSDILVWTVPSHSKACVVSGKVKHSQKLSADPLQPWVAVENEGLVVCAHCNCMAGLGEACSHIAALLFLLEANSQKKKSLSCTSQPCYWLPPSFKSVPYVKICDTDFTNAQRKLKKITSVVTTVSQSSCLTTTKSSTTSSITTSVSELHGLFSELSEFGKPGLLSLVPEFSDAYVPLRSKGIVPPPLSDLYKEEFLSLCYPELLKKCEETFVNLSIEPQQAIAVEEKLGNSPTLKHGSGSEQDE